jgi:CRP-like cAMP-binding protein
MIEPAAVCFFTGLGRKEIGTVLSAGTRLRLKASEIIGRADEPANRLFLVRDGAVDYFVVTSDGRKVLLRRLVSGNIFGVGALLSEPAGYAGTSKTMCCSELLAWEHTVIRKLAGDYPRLAENALRTALRYIAIFAERHFALVSKPAQERLACALTSLGSRSGHIVPTGVEVDVKNEDLASLADVSSFTASRFLNKWERQGVVEKSRRLPQILASRYSVANSPNLQITSNCKSAVRTL